ncbi:MAG: stage IV sporulation protein A [Ruminococcaceae bacterium]|nr:stage IV sporulation protein A [Oscillospiraceae bacterium]
MEHSRLYEDIAARTGGDIYIAVVGPVRTGKSTFIKKFMETVVIPNIDNVYKRERAKDELPQSGSGRTVMTMEPKFVPEEAVTVNFGKAKARVRLIDSVGYLVDGAIGQTEEGVPRMVTTPWFEHEIPMYEAAETGTRKVITDHSTVGIVMTTDGSVTELPRESYLEAENKTISELKKLGKPFMVLLNTVDPNSQTAISIKKDIEKRHGVSCLAVNCLELTERDILDIFSSMLMEFPLTELQIFLPDWVEALAADNVMKTEIFERILNSSGEIVKLKDAEKAVSAVSELEHVKYCEMYSTDLAKGIASISIEMPRELFYKTLTDETGVEVTCDGDLMAMLTEMAAIKKDYEKVSGALEQVRAVGYGIVMPDTDEMTLQTPEIIKSGGSYGVKLKASAPSIHMIRADIEAEISPIVGSEKQSQELVNYLLSEFEEDTEKLWQSNIFGKSLFELVNEGLNSKLKKMPDEARLKLRDTLCRIINEGSGGLICIIL